MPDGSTISDQSNHSVCFYIREPVRQEIKGATFKKTKNPKDKEIIESLAKLGAGVCICLNPQENPTLRSIENTKALRYFTTDWDVCKEEDNLSKEEITRRKQQQLEN